MKLRITLIAAVLFALPALAQKHPGFSGTPLPESAALPQWPHPPPLNLPANAPVIRSQDLELAHAPGVLGGFIVRVAGQAMAVGQTRPMIGYLHSGELKWLNLAEAADRKCVVRAEAGQIHMEFACTDPDGARWHVIQTFAPGPQPRTIDIETDVAVEQERDVAFLPMFMLFPGAGSFGAHKDQALFAGLEYLEDEPSSSEADVIGPASKRQVPDTLKVTFPLMAIQSQGRYLALTWEMRPQFAPVFDSPDRLFASGGHVFGLLFPGSNGKNRQEGDLLPHFAEKMYARIPAVLRVTLMGGIGKTVVPAIQQYLALRGRPPMPAPDLKLADYVPLATGAWLDSGIRESNLFHHAIAGGHFPAGPAADAAVWMDWLARRNSDPAMAARLRETSREAIAAVPVADFNFAGVGHVRYPVASLIYGHVAENASRAAAVGRQVLSRFEPDGSIRFHPQPGGLDYARTHYTNEANGLTSTAVLELLGAATVSGDRDLLSAALKELRAMDQFRNGVPRGAQTWECPLHTPDILAAAHLVRAYTLGYELTGDSDLLDQARYWAWTGVPFVYLVNPAQRPIGLYATIAVFGATQWKAPVWLGLPVQWCGLVYADALYHLVRDDPMGPWKTIADGITLSGIQQSWPLPSTANGNEQPGREANLQGLLPDSFVLRTQHRNGPAINPATVQACAAEYFAGPPVYDFRAFRQNKLLVHAPGLIGKPSEKAGWVSFAIETDLADPYYVLVNGLQRKPKLRVNGTTVACAAPHEYHEKEGWLILKLEGRTTVELTL